MVNAYSQPVCKMFGFFLTPSLTWPYKDVQTFIVCIKRTFIKGGHEKVHILADYFFGIGERQGRATPRSTPFLYYLKYYLLPRGYTNTNQSVSSP